MTTLEILKDYVNTDKWKWSAPQIGRDNCIEILDLIKEHEERKWIPCSERLPEENICNDGYVEPSDWVLCFTINRQYKVSRFWGNRLSKHNRPESFPDWMDIEHYERVIAWMPLPEPYKESD